jgi:hypothetical protein
MSEYIVSVAFRVPMTTEVDEEFPAASDTAAVPKEEPQEAPVPPPVPEEQEGCSEGDLSFVSSTTTASESEPEDGEILNSTASPASAQKQLVATAQPSDSSKKRKLRQSSKKSLTASSPKHSSDDENPPKNSPTKKKKQSKKKATSRLSLSPIKSVTRNSNIVSDGEEVSPQVVEQPEENISADEMSILSTGGNLDGLSPKSLGTPTPDNPVALQDVSSGTATQSTVSTPEELSVSFQAVIIPSATLISVVNPESSSATPSAPEQPLAHGKPLSILRLMYILIPMPLDNNTSHNS